MKIGVTGIFASGKGTVCEMFRELGAKVIDTDILAREVVEPGSIGLKKLVEEFGNNILNSDGALNRRGFANSVFSSPDNVKKLNEITHPLIFERMMELISRSPNDIFMINTPLLFESGFNKLMDLNITVTAKVEDAVKRGILRDKISEKEIKERLKNQISLKEKVKLSDYNIDNSGTLENTKRQVLEIWKTLRKKTIKA